MIDPTVVADVLDAALRRGGTFAEVFGEDRRGTSGSFDDGRIERVGSSRSRGAGIRVVAGDTTGFAHTADLSAAGLLAAAEAAGHRAFASADRQVVMGSTSWLTTTANAATSDITVALRLQADLPNETANGPSPDGEDEFRAVLQVSSRLDPSLVLDAAEVWRSPHAVIARFGAEVEDEVLLALRRGSGLVGLVKERVTRGAWGAMPRVFAELPTLAGFT